MKFRGSNAGCTNFFQGAPTAHTLISAADCRFSNGGAGGAFWGTCLPLQLYHWGMEVTVVGKPAVMNDWVMVTIVMAAIDDCPVF